MNSPACAVPAALLWGLVCSSLAAAAEQQTSNSAETARRGQLEKAFAEKLSGATLVGSFTVLGKNDGKPPRPERYELGTVRKLKDDYWLFVAKMKYGSQDYKIPIPLSLKVLWAGDTPVITLTNFKIPGMQGAFSARVLFYGDRYVGTWQHGKAGGHMFGVIEPAKKPAGTEAKKPKSHARSGG